MSKDKKLDFEIIDSKIIYEGSPNVKSLRVDKVKLKDGNIIPREVIVRSDGSRVVAITKENKLLMVKEYRYAAEQDILLLPGGAVNDSEKPENAAKRELLEETGYGAKEFELLFKTYGSCLMVYNVHFFLAKDLYKSDEKAALDFWEDIKLYPIDFKEAIKKAKNAEFADPATNLAIIMAAERLSKTE